MALNKRKVLEAARRHVQKGAKAKASTKAAGKAATTVAGKAGTKPRQARRELPRPRSARVERAYVRTQIACAAISASWPDQIASSAAGRRGGRLRAESRDT